LREQKKQPGAEAAAILIPQSAVHDENGKMLSSCERRQEPSGAR